MKLLAILLIQLTVDLAIAAVDAHCTLYPRECCPDLMSDANCPQVCSADGLANRKIVPCKNLISDKISSVADQGSYFIYESSQERLIPNSGRRFKQFSMSDIQLTYYLEYNDNFNSSSI